MATQTLPTAETAHDAFPINGTDYVEFYVGSAKQASDCTAKPMLRLLAACL